MRKIFQMMVMLCMIVFTSQAAYAAYLPDTADDAESEVITEGVDLNTIHSMAVGHPRYNRAAETDPSFDHLLKIIGEAGKRSKCQVLTFDEVADNILRDKHLNIRTIDEKKTMEEFKKHVADYADAYIITWVANNSRTCFFFDVYKSGTDKLLYTCEVRATKYAKDDPTTFKSLSEQFYKKFDRAAEKQQEDKEKAEKKRLKELAKNNNK